MCQDVSAFHIYTDLILVSFEVFPDRHFHVKAKHSRWRQIHLDSDLQFKCEKGLQVLPLPAATANKLFT